LQTIPKLKTLNEIKVILSFSKNCTELHFRLKWICLLYPGRFTPGGIQWDAGVRIKMDRESKYPSAR